MEATNQGAMTTAKQKKMGGESRPSSASLPFGGAAVVVGGGVAGTAAAAELCKIRPDARVTLVARDDKVKVATNVVRHTKYIETFDISPVDAAAFAPPNLSVVRGEALNVDLGAKELEVRLTEGGENEETKTARRLKFDVLVAATGAVPKRLLPRKGEKEEEQEGEQQPEHPRIVYLRDADSVAAAAASLRRARRVVVAGNGGIALGLAHALGSSEVEIDAAEEEEDSPGRSCRSRRRRKRKRKRVVVWAAKHGHVGDAFFDVDAAAFLAKLIGRKGAQKEGGGEDRKGGGEAPPPPPPLLPTSLVPPRSGAAPAPAPSSLSSLSSFYSSAFGAAVGPGWVEALSGAIGESDGREEEKSAGEGEEEDEQEEDEEEEEEEKKGGIDLHLNATVTSVEDNDRPSSSPFSSPSSPPFPLRVTLSDGSPPFECDAVVAAVGVRPDTSWLPRCLERAPSPDSDGGGVLVDARMRSSAGPPLLACGDACSVREGAHGKHWHQIRLWSQARATGAAAGRSAAGFSEDGTLLDEEDGNVAAAAAALPPHSLELFAHATSVAGLRVILLGLYNGQGLEGEREGDIVTYCREEEGEGGSGGDGGGSPSFARALLLRGRLAGAVLIGDTGLEGVFEDLIMDGIDVSFLGPRLLDPDLDLEAIFD